MLYEKIKKTAPTGLSIKVRASAFAFKWAKSLDPQFLEFVLYRYDTLTKANNDTTPTEVYRGTAVRFRDEIEDLTQGADYFYRLFYVDIWGNESDMTAVVGGTYSAVKASDIVGQLADAQIGTLAASKLIGQILANQIPNGAIDKLKMATGLAPVEILGTLPTSGNFDGRQVFLTTDGKLYRWRGSTGAFTANLDVSNLAGQITRTQIKDGEILTQHMTANTIDGSVITAGTLSANKIYADWLTAGVIKAGAISASMLSVGTLSAISATLGAVDISSAVIGTLTVGSINIAPGAVTDVKTLQTLPAQVGSVFLTATALDVDGDGKIDNAVQGVWTRPADSANAICYYHVDLYEAGVLVDSKLTVTPTVLFKVKSTKSYYIIVKSVSFNGKLSAGTTSNTKAAGGKVSWTGSSASVSGITQLPMGFIVNFSSAGTLDYDHTDIAITSNGVPTTAAIIDTRQNSPAYIYYPTASSVYISIRHVDRSGNPSSWYTYPSAVTTNGVQNIASGAVGSIELDTNSVTQAKLATGAVGATAVTNAGSASSSSVNAGTGSSTFLSATFIAQANFTANITLGGQTWNTVAHTSGQSYTYTTREASGGSFSFSRSAGSSSGLQLCAVTLR